MTFTDKLVRNVYKTYNYTHPVKGLVGVPTTKSLLSIDYTNLDREKSSPGLKVKVFFAALLEQNKELESFKLSNNKKETTTTTPTETSLVDQFIKRHKIDKLKFEKLAKDIDLKLIEVDGVPFISFCNFDANEFYTTDKLMNIIYKSRLLSKEKIKKLRDYSVENNLDLYLSQYYYSSYKLYAEHAFEEPKSITTKTTTTIHDTDQDIDDIDIEINNNNNIKKN